MGYPPWQPDQPGKTGEDGDQRWLFTPRWGTGSARVDRALKSKGYVAEPFSSWQRGTNENFNRLGRQYIPKKRPLSSGTDTELAIIEEMLNNLHRKRLGFKTPHELLSQSLNRVALRM